MMQDDRLLSASVVKDINMEQEWSSSSGELSSAVPLVRSNLQNDTGLRKRKNVEVLSQMRSEGTAEFRNSFWFAKRRRLRIRNWEQKDGVFFRIYSDGQQVAEGKCVTDPSLARILEEDTEIEVSSAFSGIKRKFSFQHNGEFQSCKKQKSVLGVFSVEESSEMEVDDPAAALFGLKTDLFRSSSLK